MFSTSQAVFKCSVETLTLTETIVNIMGDSQVLQKRDDGQNSNEQTNEETNDSKEGSSNRIVNDVNVSLREDHKKKTSEKKETFKCIKENSVNVLDIIVRYYIDIEP